MKSAKYLHHEMILNETPILPPPRRQQPTAIRQLMTNDWRTAEEHPNLELLIHITITIPRLAFQQFLHVRVMPVHDVGEIGAAEIGGVDEAGDGRGGVGVGAMFFKEQAEDVGGEVLSLLRHVGEDADVEVGVVGVAWGRGGDLVEEVGEPKKVIPVADGPVKVDAAEDVGCAIEC